MANQSTSQAADNPPTTPPARPGDLFADGPGPGTPTTVASQGFTAVLLDTVIAARGAEGVGMTALTPFGGGKPDVLGPIDPCDGIRVARRLEYYAEAACDRYVRVARGQGVSWAEIGPALGVTPDPDAETSYSVQVYDAFRQRLGGLAFHINWNCFGCARPVAERSPASGNPADTEHGHADHCPRHQADLAAWHAATKARRS